MKKKAVFLSCMLVLPQLMAVPMASAENPMVNQGLGGNVKAEIVSSQVQAGVTAVSKEQAIDIAKGFIEIPKEFSQQSVNYQSNWYPGNRTVWNVNWNKQTEQGYGSINITIDAETGTVISMNRWDDTFNQQPAYPPKVNAAKAKELAQQFIKQKAPQKENLVKLDETVLSNQKPPLQGNASYYFPFMRVENGISFLEQFISVGVNGNGEITSYEYRWDDYVKIPETNGMIKQDEAVNKIKATLPIELKYNVFYRPQFLPSQPNTVKLAYDSRFSYPYIDAKTGQWLDYTGKPVDLKEFNETLEPLSKEKPNQNSPVKNELTQNDAIELAKKYFSIPDTARLENVSFNDKNEHRPFPTWDLNWMVGENQYWVYVSINGQTGQVLNYSKDDPNRYRPLSDSESINQQFNYEQAKDKAIEHLKTFAADRLHELTFSPMNNIKPDNAENMREFTFTFNRIVDGIIMIDQFINVSISSETGNLYQYYQNWNDHLELPDTKSVVSIEKAKQTYFENYNIVPKYVYIENFDYNTRTKSKPEVKLVYQFMMKPQEQPVYLDANLGKWVSIETGEPIREKAKVKDITGHKNEKALQLLIDYNALDISDEGLVKPEGQMTRGEMIKAFMLITNPDPYYYKMNFASADKAATFKDVGNSSPYFAYVESAVQQGLIDKSKDELKPNEPINREELADLIVKSMRLSDLAQVQSLFNINFEDVDQITKKGEAAIVHHLGIIPTINKRFEPTKKVTRGEGAQAFYQFLQERVKYNQ
ncbi:YcdB/YcdC domain-containing protein [Bacillus sp. Marseille-P3661]|uniref:YcdB/YcdC domain-containing protein n=1 Tax=Bacillus sp. Marseille-P3661 TaxID=1936234 RepID=UPI000C832935|nr:YcdB/YcdC domain-containing protein [Bacillus sp. Marseille-P3661]